LKNEIETPPRGGVKTPQLLPFRVSIDFPNTHRHLGNAKHGSDLQATPSSEGPWTWQQVKPSYCRGRNHVGGPTRRPPCPQGRLVPSDLFTTRICHLGPVFLRQCPKPTAPPLRAPESRGIHTHTHARVRTHARTHAHTYTHIQTLVPGAKEAWAHSPPMFGSRFPDPFGNGKPPQAEYFFFEMYSSFRFRAGEAAVCLTVRTPKATEEPKPNGPKHEVPPPSESRSRRIMTCPTQGANEGHPPPSSELRPTWQLQMGGGTSPLRCSQHLGERKMRRAGNRHKEGIKTRQD